MGAEAGRGRGVAEGKSGGVAKGRGVAEGRGRGVAGAERNGPDGKQAQAAARSNDRHDRKRNDERPRETRLQIVVTWISSILLLSIVGYLVWEGTRPFTPAAFTARVAEIRQHADDYFVRLEVSNVGGQSVQGLTVVLELLDGETIVETAEGVLDWLPEDSTRDLVLILQHDPRSLSPDVSYDSYRIP
ncbi:MAG TPA: hypothetical protein VF168_07920 [Trueperaceae bacterium]